MAKKAGRVRCGFCERVLDGPPTLGNRTPRPHEQAHLEAMPSNADSGRFMYRIHHRARHPKHEAYEVGRVAPVEGENLSDKSYACPCGASFRPRDLRPRQIRAAEQGADLYLFQEDQRRADA